MLGARAGLAQIVVDHVNAFERPAVSHGTLAQGVLAQRALCVLDDLACSGLANIEIGIPFEMRAGDFYIRHGAHLLAGSENHVGDELRQRGTGTAVLGRSWWRGPSAGMVVQTVVSTLRPRSEATSN